MQRATVRRKNSTLVVTRSHTQPAVKVPAGCLGSCMKPERMSILHNRYSYTENIVLYDYLKNSLAPSALTFRVLHLISKLFMCELNLDIACGISAAVAIEAVDIMLRFTFRCRTCKFPGGSASLEINGPKGQCEFWFDIVN